jgi:tetratricopeptide (TPR) repeat protein
VNLDAVLEPARRRVAGSAQQVLKCAIDLVEIWVKFIAVLLLGETRRLAESNQDIGPSVGRILWRKRPRNVDRLDYSLGDWFSIAADLARLLCPRSGECVLPEALQLIQIPGRGLSPLFQRLRSRVPTLRNRLHAHGYLQDERSEELSGALEFILRSLEEVLAPESILDGLSVELTLYRTRDRQIEWTVRGIQVEENVRPPDGPSDPVRVRVGPRVLGLSPFAFFATIPLELDFYFMFEAFLLRSTALRDVSYLGIAPMRSCRRLLSSFEGADTLAREFSSLFRGVVLNRPAFPLAQSADDIAHRTEGTIDRPAVRETILGMLDHTRLLVVEAPPGAGKSTMAAWMALRNAAVVHFHRWEQGAAPMRRFFQEVLVQACELLDEPVLDIPEEEARLREAALLVLARIAAAGRVPLIVLDGLDELSPSHDGDLFSFLDDTPGCTRVVIFTRPVAAERLPKGAARFSLPPLARYELAQLPEIQKLGLTAERTDEIWRFSEGNPLIAIMVARDGGKDAVPCGLREYYLGLLNALDRDGDGELAREVLSLLAISARPLRYDELHRLVSEDKHALALPAVSRVFLRLKQYLAVDRDGGCRLFHRSFSEVVIEYLGIEHCRAANRTLARYFMTSAKPGDIALVPFHTLEGGDDAAFDALPARCPKSLVDFFVSRASKERDLECPIFDDTRISAAFWRLHRSAAGNATIVCAQVCYYLGFWDEARRLYESVESKGQVEDPALWRSLQVTLGALYKNLDCWDDARTILERAILEVSGTESTKLSAFRLASLEPYYPLLNRLVHNLASILYDQGRERPAAVRLFHLARQMAQACGDQLGILAAENAIFCSLIERGAHEEAARVAGKLGEAFKGHPVEDMYFRLNLLALYLRKADIDSARAVLRQSAASVDDMERLLLAMGNRQLAAYYLNNAAVLFHLGGDSTTAERLARSSIRVCEQIRDRCMCAGAMINLGMFTRDLAILDRAEAIAREIGDEEEVTYVMHNVLALGLEQADLRAIRTFYEEVEDLDGLRSLDQPRPWIMTQFLDLFLPPDAEQMGLALQPHRPDGSRA